MNESQEPSHKRPPPFIALKGPKGKVNGYVRADRIETIVLDFVNGPDVENDSTERVRTWCARISMFNGVTLFSRETPNEVFAKMADALHIPQEDES